MNVWLDDKRPMPPGYDVHVIRAIHAIKLLRCGLVDCISLDHDLGEELLYGTGYHVATAIEEMAHTGHLKRHLTVYIHSQNPVGVQKMLAAIQSAAAKCDRITYMPYVMPTDVR